MDSAGNPVNQIHLLKRLAHEYDYRARQYGGLPTTMEVEQLFVTMSVSKSKNSKRHVLEDVDWMSERKRRRKDSVRYTKVETNSNFGRADLRDRPPWYNGCRRTQSVVGLVPRLG